MFKNYIKRYTEKEMIGKYFINHGGVILITDIHNEYIYDYVDVDIDENGNVIDTERYGYITPQELTHYEEF